MKSPYSNAPVANWQSITEQLVQNHPLRTDEIVDVTLQVWNSIFTSSIGGFHIGKDIFPRPQIMGYFLQELIALEFIKRYPGVWRGEQSAADKDIVYVPDTSFSIEVKTSSDPNHIFGNRSYAQDVEGEGKKEKTGYYLAVNFQKFTQTATFPRILKIRFGWLDHSDWLGQKAATGQQARLASQVESLKLLLLYSQGGQTQRGLF